MKMLKSILSIALLFIGLAVSAQQNDHHKIDPAMKADKLSNKLSVELGLDENRKAELRTIYFDHFTQLVAIMDNQELSKENKKTEVDQLRASHNSNIQKFLSDEEYVKYQDWEQKRKERQQAMKDQHLKSPQDRADFQTMKMVEHLDLTDEQAEKVAELNLLVEEKIEAIRTNDNLSPEKKKEFIKGNHEDHRNALSSILTPEQMAKLQEMKKKKEEAREQRDNK